MDGKELKLLRVATGLTQWDLAREVGIHPSRISEMKKDHREVSQAVMLPWKRYVDVNCRGHWSGGLGRWKGDYATSV